MPYYPDPELDKGIPYETENYWEHVVADYLGCSFFDVLELQFVDFLLFRREAFISRLSGTKEGQEYLNKAYMYESTEADYAGLRKELGRRR